MTMMIMMIIITFCALDISILEFLTCKWQLVWNMLIKFIIIISSSSSSSSSIIISRNYGCVKFVNLSMSSHGVFSDECSTF